MRRINWQELARTMEDDPRPSAAGDGPSPPQAENTASPSDPGKNRIDRTVEAWQRSERVRIEMLVDVCLCVEDQEPVFTRCKTVDVSAHGALLDVTMPVDIGQTLRLVNVRTKREIECHVLRFAKRYPEGGGQIAIDFVGVSPHFWGIASPPADWDPEWVPAARPQRPVAEVPATPPLPGGTADVSPGKLPRAEEPSREHLQAPAIVRTVSGNYRIPKWRVVALVASAVLFAAWIAMRAPNDADSTAVGENALPAGVAPDDARRIPRIERTRLATVEDFDPEAISWLRGSGQQASGKIPGFYSGSKKSNAYILVGKANERHVVIFAGGGLGYNAEFPVIAIAACVPVGLVHKIKWADSSVPESDGDGLLIVRSADGPSSAVVLFLRGSQVVSASPTDYHEVAFGQGCQSY